MSDPDSLLSAARKVADAAGWTWAEVQPFYRALQEPGGLLNSPWLPKSLGRNIWAAQPNFVTRLLVALAAAERPSMAHATMDWVFETTPNGRERFLRETPAAGVPAVIEAELFKYLTNVSVAADLVQVEFQPDLHRVVFETVSNSQIVFERRPIVGGVQSAKKTSLRGIYNRGVISGAVFVSLAKTVSWRLTDDPPFEGLNGRSDPDE